MTGPFLTSLNDLEIFLNDGIREHLQSQYNHEANGQLDGILRAMKRPPAFTTCRVNLIRATRKEVFEQLKSLLSHLPHLQVLEDPKFFDVIHIVPRSSENGSLEECLSTMIAPDDCETAEKKDPPSAIDVSFPTWPSRKDQGWPMGHRSVIVDRFCGEAVLRGSDIFVKGVLAADTNIRPGEKVAVYADIPSIDGRSSEKVLRGMKLEHYRGTCVYLGLGVTECSRSEIFQKNQGVGISMSLAPKDRVGPPLPPLSGVLPDKMMLQNLPSIWVGHALNPQPKDIILDMCSAPGGKTSHLASLVRNDAVIVACDKSKKKVRSAQEFFRKMGASCITPLALDATNCCIADDDGITHRKSIQQMLQDASVGKDGLKQIKRFPPESFDKILLDPPCSALGLRPKLFVTQESMRELNKHADYQRKFVAEAVKLLKVGGYMTYSTCTINADENEGMVQHILNEYPCMELLPMELSSTWSQNGISLPGLPGFGLTTEQRDCVYRFDPSSSADTMGFFVALFRKTK